MADDEDDGLVLNFNTSGEGLHTGAPRKRKEASKQRWLREHKRQKPNARPSPRGPAPGGGPEAGPGGPPRSVQARGRGGGGAGPREGTAAPGKEKGGRGTGGRTARSPSEGPQGKASSGLSHANGGGGGGAARATAVEHAGALGGGNTASKRGRARAAVQGSQLGGSKGGGGGGGGRTPAGHEVSAESRGGREAAAERGQGEETDRWRAEAVPGGPAGSLPQAPAGSVFAAETFSQLGLAPALAQHMEGHLGFRAPTHIQKAAVPAILAGHDVLVKADTGTGKTLVYLAPIFSQLQGLQHRLSRTDGTYALVLAPTRELCLQIHAAALQLARRFVFIVPGHVMGGENKAKEKARFRKGVTVLVATPGRLLDHLQNTEAFRHDHLRWLVFDEADRLLDLGFEKDILEILAILGGGRSPGEGPAPADAAAGTERPRRQTLLLSATLTSRVAGLAKVSLQQPVTVDQDSCRSQGQAEAEGLSAEAEEGGKGKGMPSGRAGDEWTGEEGEEEEETPQAFRIPSQLSQHYLRVPCRLRLVALAALLHHEASAVKSVVFFSTCDAVEFHHALFSAFRLSPAAGAPLLVPCPVWKLHGSLTQRERTEAFFAFGRAAAGTLLCTDVAARGLDFPAVTRIVQYDPAGEAAAYVHRVGRTARLGQRGEAVLFLQPAEAEYLGELQGHGVQLQERALGALLDAIPLGGRGRGRGRGREGQLENHLGGAALQARLEAFIAAQAVLRQLATDAFRSFVRAYAAQRGSLKRIFHPKRLHLGHVAKSFGLTDAPSLLGQSSTKKALEKQKEEKTEKLLRKKRRLRPANVLE